MKTGRHVEEETNPGVYRARCSVQERSQTPEEKHFPMGELQRFAKDLLQPFGKTNTIVVLSVKRPLLALSSCAHLFPSLICSENRSIDFLTNSSAQKN